MRSRLIRQATQFFLVVAFVALASDVATATGVVYPLKMSANGRYLVDANNLPHMMVGDAPQALTVNVSEADAEMFFANRQARGFNTVWINLLCNTYTGGRTNGSTIDGIVPFTAALPSSASLDLGTPNEAYFAHVDRVLGRAAGHGLQVLLDPIETGGWLTTMVDNGPTKCRDYGRFLGNRYKSFDNILWMSGNDFQSWTVASYDTVVQAVALGIQDNDTRHLQTLELDYPASSSLDDTNWTSMLGFNATYTYYPTYARLLQDYARINFRPNFMVEARYEFEGASVATLRKQEYWSMTSGAMGQIYGNGHTWPFLADWKNYVDTPGALEMRYLVGLFAPRAWYDLVPDPAHTIVTAGYGSYSDSGTVDSNDYATAARTPDGSLVVIYVPVVRSLTVNMTKLSGAAITRWYDPSTGIYVPIAGSPFANTGSRSFTPPGNNGDGDGGWALVLETTPPESQVPTVTLTAPSNGVFASGVVSVSANASDNTGVVGVQFAIDGWNLGWEVPAAPYARPWDSRKANNGSHVVSATARDLAGNRMQTSISVTVNNPVLLRLGAAYAFDETGGTVAADASGNGNAATLHGGTWTAGKHGNALTLNGTSNYVEAQNTASLDIGGSGLTIAFWLKVNSTSSGLDYVVVSKPWYGTSMAGPVYQYGVQYSNSGNKSLDFSFGDPNGIRHGPFHMTPAPSVWTYAAFTFDGNTVKGYLDGVQVLMTPDAGMLQARGNSLRIGADGGYKQFFNGSVDDLRIYGRALTQAEIQSLMQTMVGQGPGAVLGSALNVNNGASGTLDLTWTASCTGAADNYEIYEGTLPIAGAYNHVPLNCNLGNVTTANITPTAGDRYYLIVAGSAASEGSYGIGLIAGSAQEIPQGAGACYPQQLSSCP